MKNEVKHTAHSSYRCEYHIVFAPKYRRKVIYKEIRKDIGEIFRKLCNEIPLLSFQHLPLLLQLSHGLLAVFQQIKLLKNNSSRKKSL